MTVRPPEVDAWIDDLDDEDRALYEQVEAVIVGTGLVEQVVYAYKLPTFKNGRRTVTVSKWRGGISLAVPTPAPIESFKATHPEIAGGKISLQFRRDRELPQDDLAQLVVAALSPTE